MKQPASTTRSKLDLVTHPVRLRILMTLAGSELTPQRIAAALTDIPASSIYRHLQLLIDAGLVEVAAERRVRGTVEKTLRAATGAGSIGPDELHQLSVDDYRRTFLIFFTHLFHEFDQYLQQPQIDPAGDLIGFRAVPFYATDAEWTAAMQALNEIIRPLLSNEPRAERKARRLATISLLTTDQFKEDQS